MWATVGPVLSVVQSLAALEIAHSLLGFVRSPLFATFIQVGSRLLLVWAYSVPTAAAGT